MIRNLVVSFFLSFVASALMIGLYVFLPYYLVQRFAPKTLQTMQLPLLSTKQQGLLILPPRPTPTPTPTPTPSPDLTPVTLIIPKLNIQAAVEPVGLTETNNMDVPKNAADVAWYKHGPKPSENGNAVISGHYDTPTGRPAIFYNLKKLVVGDTIETISSNAVRSTFVVTEVASIPYDIFPSEEVFKSRPGKNVNLITCGGIWDPKKKIYSNRIVIYTTFKE